jgi:uncharacterized protein involved in exopolysaccharide biosynthesis
MSHRDGEELPAFSLRSVSAALRRQAAWLAVTTLLGLALTVYMVLRQRPVYEARATIRLADQKAAPPTDVFAALSGPSTIETEMEILRSRSVAADVVDSLGLRATIVEPKGEPRGNLFGILRLARDAAPGIYVVQRDTTVFTVTTPDGHTIGGMYGTPLAAAGLEIEPLPLGATAGAPRQIELSVTSAAAAAEAVRQGVRVSRPQTNAGIVAVAYQSTDPVLAANVVNGIATSYIGLRNEGQKQQYSAAVAFLQTQVDVYGTALNAAEGTLEQFRRKHALIDPQAQAGDQVRRRADLLVQQEELVAERSELWSLVRRMRQPAEGTVDWATLMGTPTLAKNPAISAVVQQILSAETARDGLLSRRTAADPDVVNLERTIGDLRTRLAGPDRGPEPDAVPIRRPPGARPRGGAAIRAAEPAGGAQHPALHHVADAAPGVADLRGDGDRQRPARGPGDDADDSRRGAAAVQPAVRRSAVAVVRGTGGAGAREQRYPRALARGAGAAHRAAAARGDPPHPGRQRFP